MKILPNYILKNVLSMTFLVVLIIAGIEMFVSLLQEIDDIHSGGYGIQQALFVVFASLTSSVYPLFPAAALMGCLIGLGKLASQSELLVIQAAGVSKFGIAVMTFRSAILMLLVVTMMGEVFGPKWQAFANDYKLQSQTGKAVPQDRQDIWIRQGQSFIYIHKITSEGKLYSVLRYEMDHNKLMRASQAKEGNYRDHQWVFSDIKESIFLDVPTPHIEQKHSDQQVWPIALDPDFAGLIHVNPEQMSLHTLYRYIHYLDKNGLYSKPYEFEFWKRVLQPITTLVMIGLAVPFIFGSLRTKPMGFRILTGIILGFGFYTFNTFIGPFSLLYQIPPFLAAIVPLFMFAGVDFILLGVFS